MRLQQRLIDLKYLVDEADGIYGPLTEEAVELLQGDLGMQEDGVASVEFQKKIFTTSIPALNLYDTLENGDRGTNVRKMRSACAISSIWPTRRTASLARARKTR